MFLYGSTIFRILDALLAMVDTLPTWNTRNFDKGGCGGQILLNSVSNVGRRPSSIAKSSPKSSDLRFPGLPMI
jgi:hypothetical protein